MTVPRPRRMSSAPAVIGPFAEAPRDQLGCWTLDGRAEDSVTPLAALRDALGDDVEVQHVPCTDRVKTRHSVSLQTYVKIIQIKQKRHTVITLRSGVHFDI